MFHTLTSAPQNTSWIKTLGAKGALPPWSGAGLEHMKVASCLESQNTRQRLRLCSRGQILCPTLVAAGGGQRSSAVHLKERKSNEALKKIYEKHLIVSTLLRSWVEFHPKRKKGEVWKRPLSLTLERQQSPQKPEVAAPVSSQPGWDTRPQCPRL